MIAPTTNSDCVGGTDAVPPMPADHIGSDALADGAGHHVVAEHRLQAAGARRRARRASAGSPSA